MLEPNSRFYFRFSASIHQAVGWLFKELPFFSESNVFFKDQERNEASIVGSAWGIVAEAHGTAAEHDAQTMEE